MASYLYNNSVLSNSTTIEKNMNLYLNKKFNNKQKELNDSEFIDALLHANYLHSAEDIIYILEKYEYNINSKTSLDLATNILALSLKKCLTTLNSQVIKSKNNYSTYLRSGDSNPNTNLEIDLNLINTDHIKNTFDLISNYTSNTKIASMVILKAFNDFQNKMDNSKTIQQPEILSFVNNYLNNVLLNDNLPHTENETIKIHRK